MKGRIIPGDWIWVAVFFLIPAVTEAREVRDFLLNGLTPDQAVEVVKPFLSPDGKVIPVPEQNKIIVVDSIEKVDEAERMLRQVDRRRRQVSALLQVKQMNRKSMAAAGLHNVAAGSGWYYLRGAVTAGTGQNTSTGRFQLKTSEGTAARLETGTIRPVTEDVVTWLDRQGLRVYQHSYFQSITSGFIMLPQLLPGGRLRLQVTPWLRGFDRNRQERTIEIAEASTTVEMKSGETVLLAGVEGSASSFGAALLTAGYGNRDSVLLVEITAEIE